MSNDEVEEAQAQENAPAPDDIPFPQVILFIDDSGEVQVGVKGKQFHPQEIIYMCDVVKAKLELMQFNAMMAAQQRAQNPLVIARPDVSGLHF